MNRITAFGIMLSATFITAITMLVAGFGFILHFSKAGFFSDLNISINGQRVDFSEDAWAVLIFVFSIALSAAIYFANEYERATQQEESSRPRLITPYGREESATMGEYDGETIASIAARQQPGRYGFSASPYGGVQTPTPVQVPVGWAGIHSSLER